MACRLVGTKPLSETILEYCQLGTNFNEILIKIFRFSFKKIHFQMPSAKWQPFCLCLNVLTAILSWFQCVLILISIVLGRDTNDCCNHWNEPFHLMYFVLFVIFRVIAARLNGMVDFLQVKRNLDVTGGVSPMGNPQCSRSKGSSGSVIVAKWCHMASKILVNIG